MATYVSSPTTQSGVANTRTSITKSFTLYSGYVEVDYEVSSESGFDFFRIYINDMTNGNHVHSDSGTGAGRVTSPQLVTSAGLQDIRLEFEKDGSDNAGTDNVIIHAIRIYSDGPPLTIEEDYEFPTGAAPPTGWTERLADGGTTVTGSHWAVTDTGGGGIAATIASTTTRPTAALAGQQTHVATVAATTTRPTLAAAGAQTHLGVIESTTTRPTFEAEGSAGSLDGVIATETARPTFAGAGSPVVDGVITTSVTTTLPTFAFLGNIEIQATIAATTARPSSALEGTNAQPRLYSVETLYLTPSEFTAEVVASECRARIEVERPTSVRVHSQPSFNAEISEG